MLEIVPKLLLLTMIALAIIIVEEKDLVPAVIEYSFLNLIFVIILFQLKAPDVALSAIAVGAVIVGIYLFVIAGVEE
ncbi:sodium:proton antiporter [candidate division MSBL1 archaeon SCGC-AAA259I09]|uniref:Sodium:proton antiporter n=3 Tax=candidate division MSBL1 TaxID=215777 RepID=A0A133UQR3_9EURY|nr:sodium:proton antiporter [candidate division MSBL1 archaeon SCGC-AAA259D14]KXA93379.1 sodium:proton antiporter [candidate division MSBL1 archaeon SCGC-AAA259E22]KXA96446.1 sodium:proton antiporter [candidate division MSBL1 archaeon SCGC-AAA259I09]